MSERWRHRFTDLAAPAVAIGVVGALVMAIGTGFGAAVVAAVGWVLIGLFLLYITVSSVFRL